MKVYLYLHNPIPIIMKAVTTAKLSTIAKLLARENPVAFQQMCEKSEPMLTNVKLIQPIKDKINELYPEIDRTDESILFATTVYFAYAPANIIDGSMERSPNGMRHEMCRAMDWKDAPICNHYASIGRAYFKGKTFRAKVEHILSYFSRHSVKSNQVSLF